MKILCGLLLNVIFFIEKAPKNRFFGGGGLYTKDWLNFTVIQNKMHSDALVGKKCPPGRVFQGFAGPKNDRFLTPKKHKTHKVRIFFCMYTYMYVYIVTIKKIFIVITVML